MSKKPRVDRQLLCETARMQCLGCKDGLDYKVKMCTSTECTLYPFRLGRPMMGGDLLYIGEGKYKVLGTEKVILACSIQNK